MIQTLLKSEITFFLNMSYFHFWNVNFTVQHMHYFIRFNCLSSNQSFYVMRETCHHCMLLLMIRLFSFSFDFEFRLLPKAWPLYFKTSFITFFMQFLRLYKITTLFSFQSFYIPTLHLYLKFRQAVIFLHIYPGKGQLKIKYKNKFSQFYKLSIYHWLIKNKVQSFTACIVFLPRWKWSDEFLVWVTSLKL